jgi:hypothetical protein
VGIWVSLEGFSGLKRVTVVFSVMWMSISRCYGVYGCLFCSLKDPISVVSQWYLGRVCVEVLYISVLILTLNPPSSKCNRTSL